MPRRVRIRRVGAASFGLAVGALVALIVATIMFVGFLGQAGLGLAERLSGALGIGGLAGLLATVVGAALAAAYNLAASRAGGLEIEVEDADSGPD